MSDTRMEPRAMTRITCMVHHLLERTVTECLTAMGIRDVMVETARCVRQRVRARALRLPGRITSPHDSPMDLFQAAVPREAATRIAQNVIDTAELRTPGRGMLYLQDIVQYGPCEDSAIPAGPEATTGMLRDMALLTCILSMAGSGESLARIVLTFGVGVPVVSRGVGTGLRDRLGLLRITIPAEKEIVRFMVPAHDAAGIRRILIEEGRLDRPGGGFFYQTPVREGLADPLIRLGPQRHAANMEQVIVALDELKGGTGWRKRFAGIQDGHADVDRRTRHGYREFSFSCAEGNATGLVHAAMEAGAGGATTSSATCLRPGLSDDGARLRETGILCVPRQESDAVLAALTGVAARCRDGSCRIQVLEAPAVFTHPRKDA